LDQHDGKHPRIKKKMIKREKIMNKTKHLCHQKEALKRKIRGKRKGCSEHNYKQPSANNLLLAFGSFSR